MDIKAITQNWRKKSERIKFFGISRSNLSSPESRMQRNSHASYILAQLLACSPYVAQRNAGLTINK
jgi:hypothetical protein